MAGPLNLFYEEPDPDRWLPFDRYPRSIIRRVIRGTPRPGGQARVFLNLCAGLDRLGVPWRLNDYQHARKHTHEIACVIGKPFVLDRVHWENPILFGAAVFSHPMDDPLLLQRLPVKRVLVPGNWIHKMFVQSYGDRVFAWPVGIDTDHWAPAPERDKDIDVLLYDKVRWNHDQFDLELITPVRRALEERGLSVATIRYGSYEEEDFRRLLGRSRALVFLCEHETQGIAYQQALAAGLPILAWDRGGEWQDPAYYPDTVRFGPVSSVPYWDDRCGVKFGSVSEFPMQLENFLAKLHDAEFAPRDFVLENLTLEHCAQLYIGHVEAVEREISRAGGISESHALPTTAA